MRHLIFATAILVFVVNGIACACPTEISAADHTSHQMHGDNGPENQIDCCDNMSAATDSGEQTLFAPENFKQSVFSAINLYVYKIAWDEAPASKRSYIDRDKPTPPSTPVMFFDRMLD